MPSGILTGVLVHPLLHRVLLLVDPLAVALEVDLRGWSGLAVQVDRLVLHDVGLLRFYQKHRQRLRGVRREGFWQIAQADEVIVNCETAERHGRGVLSGGDFFFFLVRNERTNKNEGNVRGRMSWERHYNRRLWAGLSIHRVKSPSFDILECLHKCILERRKFWDSSQGLQKVGLARVNHKQLLRREQSEQRQ